MTNTQPQRARGRDFLIGIVAGGMVGTALTFYFAPRLIAEFRAQVTESARRLRRHAADHVEQVSTRIGDAMDQVTRTAHAVRADADQNDVRHAPTPAGAL